MELSERRADILSAVISLYNKTGDPVGSKVLSELFLGAFSPATLRNEMAELENLGLLTQPHTSAGRIPTYKGYRFFIDEILEKKNLSQTQKYKVNNVLKVSDHSPAQFIQIANNALAQFTNYTAIAIPPSYKGITISGLEFIMINNKTVVCTMVLSSADIKNKICKLEFAITSDVLEKFCNLLNQKVSKKPIEDLTPDLLENILLTMGVYRVVLEPLLNTIQEMFQATDSGEDDIMVEGKENLLVYKDLETQMHGLLKEISNKDTLFHLLQVAENKEDDIHVMFGEESDNEALKGSSIVTARYSFGQDWKGTIGIIGPMRMDYGKIIPHIAYFADVISDTLDEAIEE